MVNSDFIKPLLVKQSFYKIFRKDFYDRLKSDIFAWLSLNPDYAPDALNISLQLFSISLGFQNPNTVAERPSELKPQNPVGRFFLFQFPPNSILSRSLMYEWLTF